MKGRGRPRHFQEEDLRGEQTQIPCSNGDYHRLHRGDLSSQASISVGEPAERGVVEGNERRLPIPSLLVALPIALDAVSGDIVSISIRSRHGELPVVGSRRYR